MAASIYATPPPDLSGEDTALSDVSNSSQTNSSNHSSQKAPKRSAVSSASSALGSSSYLDSTPDFSKKRRKQTTPIRIAADSNGVEAKPPSSLPEPDPAQLQKIFLSSLSQLQSQIGQKVVPAENDAEENETTENEAEKKSDTEEGKKEIELPDWDGEIKRKFVSTLAKPEEWLSLAGLPFPFPPEAAAALQATGYLPQLSLFGVPPMGAFGGGASGDGSTHPSAPQLRIFNKEAYCELCNKEFCNKYFLKTHKANKHGIYEPQTPGGGGGGVGSGGELPTLGQIQQMSQMLQMTEQPIASPPQITAQPMLTVESSVFCDICFKKFSNLSSMRKHRNKIHENSGGNQNLADQPHPVGVSRGNEEPETIKMPEGFREDYSIEQEDVSFTPQPRKLSPLSIQQAREANFCVEKLKRLGVLNPDSFCELCGKEYCNKYFLRTHKLKRHGILLPPDEGKEELRPSWHQVQTSPLNLSGSDKEETMKTAPIKEVEAKSEVMNPEEDEELKMAGSASPPQQDSEAISVDLQKLQSMILQLNDLNAHRAISCTLCGKEFENHYVLHGHMLTEHSGLGDNNNGAKSLSPTPSGTEQHGVENQREQSPVRDGFITPERPPMVPLALPTTPGGTNPNLAQGDQRRQPYTMTPTSSYCEICNKELCNKYFMKTHMQRMHGIEIENGAQIGGVVCNICNKELCSKYFLRVHKHNTHGIVEEGSPLPQPRQNGSDSMDSEGPFPQDANLKPGEVSDLSNRYYSHFTEVCPLCSRRFRSAKWLKAHLMSDHGKAGTEKLKELESKMVKPSQSPPIKLPPAPNGAFPLPDQSLLAKSALSGLFDAPPPVENYQCRYCSFSTPFLPFFFIHKRSHESESAVSLAKSDQQPMQRPSSTSETPTSTPTSTPVPPPPPPPPQLMSPQQQQQQQQQQRQPSPLEQQQQLLQQPQQPMHQSLIPFGKTEPNHILAEMANLTQRPAVYALPQDVGTPFMMQSFLVEEQKNAAASRFVPAVVFLPVRERIMSPVTVSFTISPA